MKLFNYSIFVVVFTLLLNSCGLEKNKENQEPSASQLGGSSAGFISTQQACIKACLAPRLGEYLACTSKWNTDTAACNSVHTTCIAGCGFLSFSCPATCLSDKTNCENVANQAYVDCHRAADFKAESCQAKCK